jgi:Xaa-Pro aminopeptidase
MLTAAGCKLRRQRLWERLPDKPDWLLIADLKNLMYFANYRQTPFLFRSDDAGAILILSRDGSAVLVADNGLHCFTEKASVDEVIAPIWYRSVESAPTRRQFLVQNTLERLTNCSGQHFGIETGRLPAGIAKGLRAARPGVQFLAIDQQIADLRRRKDADEIELMKKSMRAGEAGMKAAREGLRPGITEMEAYFLVQRAANEALGEQALVYGDFVSGPRCERIGGPPSQRQIETGDLFIVDFSTVVDEYRADFTNTFIVGATPTSQQRDLSHACLDALQAGEAELRAGTTGRAVYEAVRGAFAKKNLAEHFPHHAGHGIGLSHPEPPYLVPQSAETLVAGDIVTLEPGLYIKGVAGIRFERNYLITDSGYELLSHHALGLE